MIRARAVALPPSPAGRWLRAAVVLATLAGLVFMHQVGGPPPGPAAHHHGGHGAHQRTVLVPCHCPDLPHGHPGQACQAKPPNGSTAVPAPPAGLPAAPARPDRPLTPSTADDDAAGGSGCGPPARAELAIWRI
jgi:hypothetical protein